MATLTPPETKVPEVQGDNYPTLGTAPSKQKTLTPAERAKLQSDLEGLATSREGKVKRAIESDQ